MTRVLDVKNLEGGYGSVQILHGIDIHVDEGEFVTVIGPNGCGNRLLSRPSSESLPTTLETSSIETRMSPDGGPTN